MDKFIKVLCLSLTVLMFVPSAADAGNRGKKKSSEVNWEPVINAIIQVILGDHVTEDLRGRADVNGDGEVTVGDINSVIDLIV